MIVEMRWSELVHYESRVAISEDSVRAAGLDPAAREDVLLYLRDHANQEDWFEQVDTDADFSSVECRDVDTVEEIDLTTRRSA